MSTICFILAGAGLAAGLGNVWKFPTLVSERSVSALILLYIILTLAVGFVIFLAEFSIGRLSEQDTVHDYATLAPSNNKDWSYVGFTMVGA
ncbi:hypothetical protein H4987_09545, partial [Campylobacter jejuni]|nr:hypothetical protein [Campylobacter jejuni]